MLQPNLEKSPLRSWKYPIVPLSNKAHLTSQWGRKARCTPAGPKNLERFTTWADILLNVVSSTKLLMRHHVVWWLGGWTSQQSIGPSITNFCLLPYHLELWGIAKSVQCHIHTQQLDHKANTCVKISTTASQWKLPAPSLSNFTCCRFKLSSKSNEICSTLSSVPGQQRCTPLYSLLRTNWDTVSVAWYHVGMSAHV